MTIKQRFNAKTPKFFKRVQKICASLIVLGGSLQAVPNLNPACQALGINMIVAGTVTGLAVQFAVDSFFDEKPKI